MNALRRPANLPFLPDDRTYNRTVNQIRYMSKRHREHQALTHATHRLQKTIENLPDSHHSSPLNHIHLRPTNLAHRVVPQPTQPGHHTAIDASP